MIRESLCNSETQKTIGRTRVRQVHMASMPRAAGMIQCILQKGAKTRVGANPEKYA